MICRLIAAANNIAHSNDELLQCLIIHPIIDTTQKQQPKISYNKSSLGISMKEIAKRTVNRSLNIRWMRLK